MENNIPAYSCLFQLVPDPVLVYDLHNYSIIDVNDAGLSHYGYSKEEFLSLKIDALFHKNDLQLYLEAQQNSLNSEQPLHLGTFVHETKRGKLTHMDIRAHLTTIDGQERVLLVAHEVTRSDNKPMEISQMMDASLDVFCVFDKNNCFVHASAAAYNHWGYLPEELIGRSIDEFIVDEDIQKTNEIIVAIKNGQAITSFVNRYNKKNGGLAYNLWSARWEDGSDLRFAVARDCKDIIELNGKISLSEQRFKALVQEGSDLIAILDFEGNYKYVSPTSTAVIGITPEDLLGRNALDFVHPDDLERTITNLQEIAHSKRIIVEPFRFKNNDNEWRWIETILTNMLEHPAVQGIVANSRDVTEIIRARNETETKAVFSRAVVESSPDCLKVIDNEGQIQYMNANGLCRMEIDDFSSIKGKKWWTLWGQENQLVVQDALHKALSGENTQFSAFCPTTKGTPKWWDVTVSPVLGKVGEPIEQIISISRDITEQKKEEQQLKLLESVVTNTNDAILITEAEPLDHPGPRIIYVNDAFTKMTGYSAAEVIGKSPRMLQGPNSDKKELQRLSNALRNWESCEITTLNYKKDGEEFWINISVTPVADESGWYTHWIAIQRDVTEQKTKEIGKELLAQISEIFNVTSDYSDAAKELCKTISTFGKFDWVELWTSNTEKSFMQLFAHYLPATEDEIFYENGAAIKSFAIDEGIAGKIWREKKQILYKNISIGEGFVRKSAALKIGLQTVLGIPLLFNNEVIGVLKIGSKHSANQLTKITPLLEQLEVFIGSELTRKKLESELNLVFNTIQDVVSLVDFNGKILQINKAGCNMLGYNQQEILGKSFDAFIHPEDKEVAFNELERLKTGAAIIEFENRYITKTGEVIWISWSTNLVAEKGIVFATGKNITEEKKLRELIRQTNNLAKIGSWEINLKNQSLFWSDEVHFLHETDPKSYDPDLATAINFYRSDFQKMVQSVAADCVALCKPFDFEAVIITTSKQEKWVRAIGNTENVNGECIRIYGSFQDISERKEVEIKLQSLANNLPGLVYQYLIHPDGTDELSYATKGAEEVWGYSAEEVVANNQLVWSNIANAGEVEKVQKSVSESIATKSQWTCRWNYVMPNGEMKTHLGYGTPTFLTDGTVLYNSVILDVTQEAKNEALLEQVTKQAKIGSWVVDLINEDYFLSDVAISILELDVKHIIPDLESTVNYFRPDYRSMAISKITQCIKLGTSFDFEAVIVTSKKTEKWVRAIGSAKLSNGKCTKIFGSIQDISSLKDAENRLISISQNLPGVVYQYLIHPDGSDSMRYISAGAEQIWGFTADKIMENLNIVWNQIKLGGHFEEVQSTILQSIHTKVKWSCRIKYVMPTGELRTHLGYGTPEFLADGTVLFNSIVLDITQEAKNEELLEQTTAIARIGSWELDLLKESKNEMYWSPMTREILEMDQNYEPSYSACLELHVEESKSRLGRAMDLLIAESIPFDEELLLITPKGNERWVRCIGKSETVNNKRTKVYGSLQDISDKKVAAEKLQKSLEEKSTILESIGDAFFAVDNQWIVTYWNKEAELVLGRKKEDILGRNLWEEYPDVVDTEFYTQYHKAVKTKQAIYFEPFYAALKMWLEVSAYPSSEGLSVYFKNVTLRKEVEQVKNSLQTTLENSLNEIYTFDSETLLFSYVNKGALNNLGYSNEEVATLTPLDIKPEFTEKKFNKLLKPLLSKKKDKIIFFTIHRRKDASTYPVEIHLQLINEGNRSRFLAIALDITERNQYEANILMANERFEKVTEATKDAIWDWDIANQTYYCSKAIENFFGKNAKSLYPEHESWKDKFHPDDFEGIQTSMLQALEDPTCTRWEYDYRLINELDKILYVVDRGMIIRDSDGKAIRMVGAMTDITERKQMTLQLSKLNKTLQQHTLDLERSNEELEQFAYIASHDLQEPLRMVTSFLTLIEKKYGTVLDEKGLQYINFAVEGARNMRQIILDLLSYSKISTVDDNFENIELEAVIKDICLLQSRLIREKKAKINIGNLPQLFSIRHYLLQLFQNIISNALKYSEEDTPPIITVSSKSYPNYYIIAVRDNGIGIEKEYFEKIFVLFQRLHAKDEFQGNGMGLAIAKKIVDKLNGKIWVESEPTVGSTFYIQIPKTT